MKSIDVKSLLIGILGTALVMVLMGQSSISEKPTIKKMACIEEKEIKNYKWSHQLENKGYYEKIGDNYFCNYQMSVVTGYVGVSNI